MSDTKIKFQNGPTWTIEIPPDVKDWQGLLKSTHKQARLATLKECEFLAMDFAHATPCRGLALRSCEGSCGLVGKIATRIEEASQSK